MAAANIASAVNATTPDPTPQTASTPALPAGQVWEALTAAPSATVVTLAKVAGVSQAAVRRELARYEQAGWAVRTAGKGRNGDIWTRTPPGPATPPATGTRTPQDGPTAPVPAAPDDTTPTAIVPATDDTTAPDTPHGTAVPVTTQVMTPEMIAHAMALMAAEADRREAAEAELVEKIAAEQIRRAAIEAELAKARTTETTRQALTDLLAAVTNTYTAVIAGDETATAAGLDQIFTHTDHVRKATRTAAARTNGIAVGPPAPTALPPARYGPRFCRTWPNTPTPTSAPARSPRPSTDPLARSPTRWTPSPRTDRQS